MKSMSILKVIYVLVRNLFVNRSILIAENLALRQQLAVRQRTIRRPKLHKCDRIFWVFLSHIWQDWKSALVIVKPETVMKWHGLGFKLYWCWKSRTNKVGRPKVKKKIRDLIRRMSQENPTWGVPRIQSELHLSGYDVAESTISKYMVRKRKPPSQKSVDCTIVTCVLTNHQPTTECNLKTTSPTTHCSHMNNTSYLQSMFSH